MSDREPASQFDSDAWSPSPVRAFASLSMAPAFPRSFGPRPCSLSRAPRPRSVPSPALAVLRGPLALVLVVALRCWGAVLAAAGSARPALAVVSTHAPARRAPCSWPPAASFVVVRPLVHEPLRVSGDEPHYLLMAQSLWREGDLDLRDNYAREDWREYTPGPVPPHYGAPRRTAGRSRPTAPACLCSWRPSMRWAGARRASSCSRPSPRA